MADKPGNSNETSTPAATDRAAGPAGPFDARWQFWIDVGGTFTDCIAQPPRDGAVRLPLRRLKLLSSAVTKVTAAVGSTPRQLASDRREVDGFWQGYRLRQPGVGGGPPVERVIKNSWHEGGRIELDSPLPRAPNAGEQLELLTDEESPILAMRRILELPRDQPLPPVGLRLGTTRGTNALLTRTGAATGLVATSGLGDFLTIGTQDRPRLFEIDITKPQPLFAEVVEIDERVSADGQVLQPADPEQIRAALATLREAGIHSLAICLLNAYRNGRHEVLVEQIARELGFREISRSSQVSPLVKLVPRGHTTVVDAYLNPVLREYRERLRSSLGPTSEIRLLTSAGGLVESARFSGKDSILSGPAGGVVGFSRAALAAGFERAIGFDMGGTSTDVSRFDGTFELEYETTKAGVRIVAPTLAIETVAAGGGSVCWFDGAKLCVGPQSAGADPGPACYGRGGPLAVTDLNLVLGKIIPESFPFPPDVAAAQARLVELANVVAQATGKEFTPVALADGLLRVANANMSQAVRSISIAKGYDPADYVLVAFGGAAPQHACALAEELGMQQILNHPDAGILSALGAGMADIRRHRSTGVYRVYADGAVDDLEETFAALTDAARQEVRDEGIPEPRIDVIRSLDMRYQGTDTTLPVTVSAGRSCGEAFAAAHRRLYGYEHQGRRLEIVAARVEVIGRSDTLVEPTHAATRRSQPTPHATTTANFGGRPWATSVFQRAALDAGACLVGPAIVLEAVATTVIDPGWQAEVLTGGEMLLTRAKQAGEADSFPSRPHAINAANDLDRPDPILLEIFNNHFAGIAEQMGITLRNTSSSVNVKERLDFSCALFTSSGNLVVNAPHIPVHLGAMAETVKAILADNPEMRPGDVFVTNDPFRGGSHLPDVTVVTPVYDEVGGQLRFLTASRAHHAELGGITPGSMPPFSRNLAEEGVVIRNFKVLDQGRSRQDALRRHLQSGPYPTRAVADNLADIEAQIAANQQGANDLRRLVERHTWPVVGAYMDHIQAAAEQKMRAALGRLPDGVRTFTDHLDDGSPICVAVDVTGECATIDFSGTGPVLPGNLNANRAIVTAAVMYCLRLLIDEDIPLNQGVLAPVKVMLPECLLNPPASTRPEACPAIAGGNVETSQRVVDVLLGALGIAAASQGTMNNLLFGDDQFGYYETICGGSGATAAAAGADAVHTHMTNTRLTDPEVFEQRYPVRLWRFAVRAGSGGRGRHPGGDGVVREIEFLRDLSVSILSQRRGPFAPYGCQGGGDGALGINTLIRREGSAERLGSLAQFAVQAGDRLVLETPGGGGWGVAPASGTES